MLGVNHICFLGVLIGREIVCVVITLVLVFRYSIEKRSTVILSRLQFRMKFRVEEGKPGVKICEAAEKEKALLIVMGSRGSGIIRRTVLGSVSHYVIHHTKIPVVLCPKDHL